MKGSNRGETVGPVYAVISVAEENLAIRGYLGHPALHVFIRRVKRYQYEMMGIATPVCTGRSRLIHFGIIEESE